MRLGTTLQGYVTVRGEDGSTAVTRDDEGQATVAFARALRSEGRTYREIAAQLTAEGRPTKRGGRWEAATVRYMLRQRYLEETGG